MTEVQLPRHGMWHTALAENSVQRIYAQPSVEYQQLQAQVETVAMLHSIRRILIWTLVILPIIVTVFIFGLSLLVFVTTSGSSNVSPMY